MGELQTKQPFVNLDISSGGSKESEAYNLKEIRPDGRFALQYTKNVGGGLLKITYMVSINGQDWEEITTDPVIEEATDDAKGYDEMRPKFTGYLKLKAYAVDGAISSLNAWIVVQ